jgi:excisionase family DNA binding protein
VEKLLTIREVTESLGVSRGWLNRHVRSGNVPARKIGRLVRFDEADIKKWLDENRIEPSKK